MFIEIHRYFSRPTHNSILFYDLKEKLDVNFIMITFKEYNKKLYCYNSIWYYYIQFFTLLDYFLV